MNQAYFTNFRQTPCIVKFAAFFIFKTAQQQPDNSGGFNDQR